MKRRFFLRNFLLVALPVLLSVAILGCIAVYITIDSSRESIENTNRQSAGRIREITELMFSEADAQSLNYSMSPYVMLKLEELLQKGYAEKEMLDVGYMIRTFVDSNVNSKEYLQSMYIYLNNDKGNFFSSNMGLSNEKNFRDVSWLHRAEEVSVEKKQWLEQRTASTYGITVYSTDVISLYKRLYSSNRKDPIGVLVINIDSGYLKSFYEEFLSYDGQSLALLNEDGSVLCSAGGLPENLWDRPALKKQYDVFEEKDSAFGVRYLSMVPRGERSVQAGELIGLVVLFIFIALAVGTALAYYVSRWNARNVGRIVELLDAADMGAPLPAVEVSGDEYGYIMKNIIATYVEKTTLDRQMMENRLELERMEFSFLQSQLNPHFLFNTLKNIFWKTVRLTGEPNDASHMIDLLAGVLHYALVNRERYVSVEEELDNTRSYIRIQQMRFDYSFTVAWDCDESIQEARCIKFLLQPMVENSISHGLAEKQDGRLTIRVRREGELLRFAVEDNGAGFTPERLAEIRGRLADGKSPPEGIGLYNLNKRLVLAYGRDAALSLESKPGEFTRISFSIPAARK